MTKGMFLNSKDLKTVSGVLWGEICSTKVVLKTVKNEMDREEYSLELKILIDLYCKVNRISADYLDKVFYYIDIFKEYTHVMSYGVVSKYERIDIIDKNCIYTNNYARRGEGSSIGWGVNDKSVFENDTFYPYGIDRKDVFIRFKKV